MTGPLFLPGPALQKNEAPCGLLDDSTGSPGLLCDRDGTIIENRNDYVRDPSQIKVLKGALTALRRVAAWRIPIVLVTNQSPVGRGILTVHQAVALHTQVVDALSAEGVRITATYMCPHAPASACGCRKPAPGMIHAAVHRFRLDAARTALVGDSVEDMLAARRASVHGVMVRTGRGADHCNRLGQVPELVSTPVVPDLSAAVDCLDPFFAEMRRTVTTAEPLRMRRGSEDRGAKP
ncbi:D-glycero-alpha-D-manno-heptose-1,7-bisphosphate 7-phosphatase [Streptomyces sp. NPDC102384]|uniref:D-glycero-alpha-D-manno-heptose-1,7-bisphosphate 7-phosphatase n=1 Tax=Streptomyces sp. NPDC102384 TaxID=3366166 RepID=UPI00380FF815